MKILTNIGVICCLNVKTQNTKIYYKKYAKNTMINISKVKPIKDEMP